MKKHLHKLTMLMFSQKAYDRARSVYRVALLGTTIACVRSYQLLLPIHCRQSIA